MQVTVLSLENFRSFKNEQTIQLGKVNVLTGKNNTGKSSIIRALHLMQVGGSSPIADIRINESNSKVCMTLDHVEGITHFGRHQNVSTCKLTINLGSAEAQPILLLGEVNAQEQKQQFPNTEPNHFIVPFLSKRKTTHYQEDIKSEYTQRIDTDMTYLGAKLSRLGSPSFPGHAYYRAACENILGFLITSISSQYGQRPGVYLSDRKTISIDQMGEGVPNIVALLADLTLSEGKLFLIEEPENDLHPAALKALLDLIIESSQKNQFVISTHSNIVVCHLCSLDSSKLFEVSTEPKVLPPIATIREIDPTSNARLNVLRDLGYALSDFNLWEGWLILEESSAERIIRDFLIPWFAPKLSCLRTMAVNGITNIEPSFADFHRLICYAHLENAYRETTWVLVDGDTIGKSTINRLQEKYKAWDSNRFNYFENEQFEKYYPEKFNDVIYAVLAETDKQKRREAKKKLLETVIEWLKNDENPGKEALEKSAGEVIEKLKKIEETLFPAKSKKPE